MTKIKQDEFSGKNTCFKAARPKTTRKTSKSYKQHKAFCRQNFKSEEAQTDLVNKRKEKGFTV